MNRNVINLFPTPVIQVIVEEDTSELLTHNQYTVSYQQRDDYEKPTASRRVLEEYPKTKEILLTNIFLLLKKYLDIKRENMQ